MSESLEAAKKLIDECSEEDLRALRRHLRKLAPHPVEREWGIDADTLLSAIARSSDLTKRGIRGIIAEAVFVDEVLPTVQGRWFALPFDGDHPYDAVLQKGDFIARIQVKLQRLQQGVPKLFFPNHYKKGTLFVVEVQKTRTGKRASEETRPYSFGDFDILAVNLHPSSRDWTNFRYTVASWLLPRPANPALIEIMQPVAAEPNDVWTDKLDVCLDWYEKGTKSSVLPELLHRKPAEKAARKSTPGKRVR